LGTISGRTKAMAQLILKDKQTQQELADLFVTGSVRDAVAACLCCG
jgi:hypothetical protein